MIPNKLISSTNKLGVFLPLFYFLPDVCFVFHRRLYNYQLFKDFVVIA